MESYQLENIEITVDRQGAERFAKVSYPIRYGRFCEIKTEEKGQNPRRFLPAICLQPNFCRKNRKYFQVSRITLKLRKNLTI
jgi:hypothetical protein